MIVILIFWIWLGGIAYKFKQNKTKRLSKILELIAWPWDLGKAICIWTEKTIQEHKP